ncbi:MAG: dihydrodipicolinate synthase family protein [Phycisphaera sp.]|nr:dihydrodipicolinate synthase family protein [Phycisphaera sp.]
MTYTTPQHSISRPLRGIVVPMVTPLRTPDALDVEGVERLVEHLVEGGVHGLFILGTTGEGPLLGHDLQRDLIDRTARAVAGRMPLLVGVTHTSLTESVRLAAYAAEAGADAVVLAPPCYFPMDQTELLRYVDSFAGAVTLPVVLYNMPALTKVTYEPTTVRRLMESDRIIGIRDSSGDMRYVHELMTLARGRADWCVLIGPETLTAEAVMFGAHGGVNGGANLYPKLLVHLYEAAAAADHQRVRELHDRVLQLGRAIYIPGRLGESIRNLKAALATRGICADAMTAPFDVPPTATTQDRLAALSFDR